MIDDVYVAHSHRPSLSFPDGVAKLGCPLVRKGNRMTNDPKIIKSPLSRKFTADGITVDVEIYRAEGSDQWTLELVDDEWTSTVWDDPFPTDQAAWEEFESGVQEIGLAALLEEDQPTVH